MVLKAKSSSLFFYPKLLISVTLKYCSDFKIKKSDAAVAPMRRSSHNDTITKPFVYILLKAINRLEVRNPVPNQYKSNLLGAELDHRLSLTLTKATTFSIRRGVTRFTVLRAPYRYKKGRYQIGYKPYTLLVKLSFIVNLPAGLENPSLTLQDIIKVQEVLLKAFTNLTTNVCDLTRLRLQTSSNLGDAFKLKNYLILR